MGLLGYSKLTRDQASAFIINCYVGVLKRYPEKEILEKDSILISNGSKTCAEFLAGVIDSTEYSLTSGGKHTVNLSKSYPNIEIKGSGFLREIKEVIYLGFATNRPIGGMKVMHHHACLINSLSDEKISAQVFFPENSDFECNWMDIKCPVKRDHVFDIDQSMVIIPELWALSYGNFFKESGIRYGIFVQNAYLLFNDINGADSSLDNLKNVYANACVILSISDHVTQLLNTYFPCHENKILQLSVSINQNIFYTIKNKKNMISYMPRKLSSHSSWVVNYLKDRIPSHWEFVAINEMKECDVASILRESKIFLSFSDQEGLGLPPLEAAISGNIVVGYTGGGGQEYWRSQIFHEIEYGDLIKFAEMVIEKIKMCDLGEASSIYPDFSKDIIVLGQKYSIKAESESIKKLLSYIS